MREKSIGEDASSKELNEKNIIFIWKEIES